MEQRTATFIALALTPLVVFLFRFVSRSLVEIAYRAAPPGWFKQLLARDRASRAKRG
jgi:hypothetical protein